MRASYYVVDLSAPQTLFVGKRYRRRNVRSGQYFNDASMHWVSNHWAASFNDFRPPKPVTFVHAAVAQLPQRREEEGRSFVLGLEPHLVGTFRKYNNNSGFVSQSALRSTPQAFSHFTFHYSCGEVMIVDIQGVDDRYTDPQILTRDGEGYGRGNLGRHGMRRFLATHRCNDICNYLRLPNMHAIRQQAQSHAAAQQQQQQNQKQLQGATIVPSGPILVNGAVAKAQQQQKGVGAPKGPSAAAPNKGKAGDKPPVPPAKGGSTAASAAGSTQGVTSSKPGRVKERGASPSSSSSSSSSSSRSSSSSSSPDSGKSAASPTKGGSLPPQPPKTPRKEGNSPPRATATTAALQQQHSAAAQLVQRPQALVDNNSSSTNTKHTTVGQQQQQQPQPTLRVVYRRAVSESSSYETTNPSTAASSRSSSSSSGSSVVVRKGVSAVGGAKHHGGTADEGAAVGAATPLRPPTSAAASASPAGAGTCSTNEGTVLSPNPLPPATGGHPLALSPSALLSPSVGPTPTAVAGGAAAAEVVVVATAPSAIVPIRTPRGQTTNALDNSSAVVLEGTNTYSSVSAAPLKGHSGGYHSRKRSVSFQPSDFMGTADATGIGGAAGAMVPSEPSLGDFYTAAVAAAGAGVGGPLASPSSPTAASKMRGASTPLASEGSALAVGGGGGSAVGGGAMGFGAMGLAQTEEELLHTSVVLSRFQEIMLGGRSPNAHGAPRHRRSNSNANSEGVLNGTLNGGTYRCGWDPSAVLAAAMAEAASIPTGPPPRASSLAAASAAPNGHPADASAAATATGEGGEVAMPSTPRGGGPIPSPMSPSPAIGSSGRYAERAPLPTSVGTAGEADPSSSQARADAPSGVARTPSSVLDWALAMRGAAKAPLPSVSVAVDASAHLPSTIRQRNPLLSMSTMTTHRAVLRTTAAAGEEEGAGAAVGRTSPALAAVPRGDSGEAEAVAGAMNAPPVAATPAPSASSATAAERSLLGAPLSIGNRLVDPSASAAVSGSSASAHACTLNGAGGAAAEHEDAPLVLPEGFALVTSPAPLPHSPTPLPGSSAATAAPKEKKQKREKKEKKEKKTKEGLDVDGPPKEKKKKKDKKEKAAKKEKILKAAEGAPTGAVAPQRGASDM